MNIKTLSVMASLLVCGAFATANADLVKNASSGIEGAVEQENSPAIFVGEPEKAGGMRVMSAGLTINVGDPVVIPAFTSPSWPAAPQRIIASMQQSAGYVPGNPETDPTAHATAIPLRAEYMMAPSDQSVRLWKGTFNPTGAFANERGNRLGFPVHIKGNGTTFSFSELRAQSDEMTSINVLDESFNYSSANYSQLAQGLHYGSDGVRGTVDDQWITSGAGTQQVNELFFIGIGVAYTVNNESDKSAVVSHVSVNHPFRVTATYTLNRNGSVTATGSRTASTDAISEPKLLISRNQSGSVVIRLEGGEGNQFAIQMANNVGPNANWSTVGSLNNTVESKFEITPLNIAFFRAVRQ